jgi:hypothetical protein
MMMQQHISLAGIVSNTLCTSERGKGRSCPRKATRVLFLGEGLEQGHCVGLLLRSRRCNKERSRGRKGKIVGVPWTGTLVWGSSCSLEEEKREEGWMPWAGSSAMAAVGGWEPLLLGKKGAV